MWWLQRIVFTLNVLAAVAGPASAAERFALLIGNRGYNAKVGQLKNSRGRLESRVTCVTEKPLPPL
jgi:hypothetical protein